jgi:hypothetical protein
MHRFDAHTVDPDHTLLPGGGCALPGLRTANVNQAEDYFTGTSRAATI